MDVRVRFAPSPTGLLHIGGARTALVNWLFARKTGGTFILRIEDTDEARSTPENTEVILDGLAWLGLDWDEGPFFQSERKSLYIRNAEKLLSSGGAYRCFCSKEELDRRRKASGKPGEWKYDGRCRKISREESRRRADSGEPFVLRCAVPDERLIWNDLVKGEIGFEGSVLEDFILVRSNGTPTYHLSVVSDDADLGITHVIRGEDHISNTPKQIALYHGLGVEPPAFGHLPLILGPDRRKLSKRNGETSVTAYRDEGILSSALFNYLASMGANLGEETNLTVTQILERFDLDSLTKAPSVFDRKHLFFVNARAIGETPSCELGELLKPFLDELLPGADAPSERAVEVMKTRAHDVRELAAWLVPFITTDFPFDEKGERKALKKPEALPALESLIPRMEALSDDAWTVGKLEDLIRAHADENGLKAGTLIHPIRFFLLGRSESPGIFDVFWAMGKEAAILRLKRGLALYGDGKSG